MMPVPLLTFVGALFQVPKHTLFRCTKINFVQPLENEEDQQAGEDLPQMSNMINNITG